VCLSLVGVLGGLLVGVEWAELVSCFFGVPVVGTGIREDVLSGLVCLLAVEVYENKN